MSQPFIQVRNLCYSYQDDDEREVPVLKNLSLDIQRGEYVVILGHNGSGKSTFAKLLNMILEANSGQILIDGQDITYDAQGNPVSYLGHALTWEKGRQLKSFDGISGAKIKRYNVDGNITGDRLDKCPEPTFNRLPLQKLFHWLSLSRSSMR